MDLSYEILGPALTIPFIRNLIIYQSVISLSFLYVTLAYQWYCKFSEGRDLAFIPQVFLSTNVWEILFWEGSHEKNDLHYSKREMDNKQIYEQGTCK